MSVPAKEILLIGSRGRKRCTALFDSGVSYSIVRRDLRYRKTAERLRVI